MAADFTKLLPLMVIMTIAYMNSSCPAAGGKRPEKQHSDNHNDEEIKMNQLKKTAVLVTFLIAGFTLFAQQGFAHCQIPCGIYDDHARVAAMLEDAGTVEKSVSLINELAGKPDAQSQNQLVRWVMNKENHAQKIISTISDYFLTQRVKSSQDDYVERLIKHHAVIVAAMNAKQNSDMASVTALKQSIEALLPYYPDH